MSLKSRLREKHFQSSLTDFHALILGTGISIAKVNYKGTLIILQIWDISTHHRYFTIRDRLQRGSFGAYFVFDINNRNSIEALPFWFETYFQNNMHHSGLVLVGLSEGGRRDGEDVVSYEQAVTYAEFLGSCIGNKVPYVEVDLEAKEQPDLIATMAQAIIEPLDKMAKENTYTANLSSLGTSTLQLLKNHHVMLEQNTIRIFANANDTIILDLLARTKSQEVVYRAIEKISDENILISLRMMLDSTYQPKILERIQKMRRMRGVRKS